MKPLSLLSCLALLVAGRLSPAAVIVNADQPPPLAFAAAEIRRALDVLPAGKASSLQRVTFQLDASLPPQGYRFRWEENGSLRVTGGDAAGAMYGGLDVAEAVRLGTLGELKEGERKPFIAQRGLKFNIPLDLRTPSYSDNSDAFQANIPEMWSQSFWREFLDEMARHRFNVLSLWSLHPKRSSWVGTTRTARRAKLRLFDTKDREIVQG